MTARSFLRHLWRSRFRVLPITAAREKLVFLEQREAALRGKLSDQKHVLAEVDAYLRLFPGSSDKRREITEGLRKKIARVW